MFRSKFIRGFEAKPLGQTLHSFIQEAPPQDPTPYPFVYHLVRKGSPFICLLSQRYPFHIPFLRTLRPFSKALEWSIWTVESFYLTREIDSGNFLGASSPDSFPPDCFVPRRSRKGEHARRLNCTRHNFLLVPTILLQLVILLILVFVFVNHALIIISTQYYAQINM